MCEVRLLEERNHGNKGFGCQGESRQTASRLFSKVAAKMGATQRVWASVSDGQRWPPLCLALLPFVPRQPPAFWLPHPRIYCRHHSHFYSVVESRSHGLDVCIVSVQVWGQRQRKSSRQPPPTCRLCCYGGCAFHESVPCLTLWPLVTSPSWPPPYRAARQPDLKKRVRLNLEKELISPRAVLGNMQKLGDNSQFSQGRSVMKVLCKLLKLDLSGSQAPVFPLHAFH